MDFGPVGDNGSFKGEVIEFELDLELSSFEGWGFRTCDEDDPEVIFFFGDDVVAG